MCRGGSGGCLRAEESRAGASGAAAGSKPAARLTSWEPLAAGSSFQASRWILLAVPNPSVLWPFRMYWLEEDQLQRCPDALHRTADPRLLGCLTRALYSDRGGLDHGGLLALSLLEQLAGFAGEEALVGWC